MNKILLSLHVLAAILTIGPIAVAASMFPRYLRLAAEPAGGVGENTPLTVARALHRICRVYAMVGIAVPFFGLALAGPLHVFGQAWVIVSIVLTAGAAALLAGVVLPGQDRALAMLTGDGTIDPVVGVPTSRAEAANLPPFTTGAPATDLPASVAVTSPTDQAEAVVVTAPEPGAAAGLAGRLAMTTGMFNLLWAAVVVIMIVRPGSTTGV